MAVFYIVLRNDAIVNDSLLGKEVDGIGFLSNHSKFDTIWRYLINAKRYRLTPKGAPEYDRITCFL